MILPWLVLTAALFTSHVSGTSHDCEITHDVAIVGAGPGGTYSAYSLRNRSLDIGLYEYSDRIGGRTYNYILPNAPDVILQMGAMRFVENVHVKFIKLSEELGLQKEVFIDGQGRPNKTRYFLRGYPLSDEEVNYGRIPYGLSLEEKQNQHRLTEFYFEKLTGYNEENIRINNLNAHDIFSFKVIAKIDPSERYLYQLSMNEALDLVASSEGKAFYIDSSKFNTLFEQDASCIMSFQSLFTPRKGQIYTLVEGMEALPWKLVYEFWLAQYKPGHKGHNVLKMNSQLTSINKAEENMYMLSFMPTEFNERLQETVVLDFKQPMKVCARKVILAIPMFALKQIDWQPLNEGVLNEAFSSYFLPTASKIFMTFNTSWWLEEHPNNLVNIGDRSTSYKQMYDWQQSNVTGQYVLLASYTDDIKAKHLHYLQKQGNTVSGSAIGSHRVTYPMLDIILQDLSGATNFPINEIPPPNSLVAQFWSEYPFGTGWVGKKAGSYYDDLVNAMRRPSLDDDVYVVGSDYAFGDNTDWTEGALETVDAMMEEYFTTYQADAEAESTTLPWILQVGEDFYDK